jgi:hypothetical protein
MFYARKSPAAEADSSSILVITADGKGVVMLPRDLREATQRAAFQRRHRLEKRLSKGEKRNAKRMATVAAVYTVAPFVRTPLDIVRILAPHNEAEEVPRPRPEGKPKPSFVSGPYARAKTSTTTGPSTNSASTSATMPPATQMAHRHHRGDVI